MVSPSAIDSVHANEIQHALDRVLNSETFSKTPSLRHMLQYVITKSIEGHPEQIKESILAIEVFSRRTDFDGRFDNIVRVQAHRLRKLLDGYYREEGKLDAVRFSIPKGSYVPKFEFSDVDPRDAQPVQKTAVPMVERISEPLSVEELEVSRVEEAPRRFGNRAAIAAAFVSGAALAVAILMISQRWEASKRAPEKPAIPVAVNDIWKDIFRPGVKVVAAYSNPAFLRVGDTRLMIRYNGPLSAPAGTAVEFPADDPDIDRRLVPKGQTLRFSDGWTGTGEVLAVNRLTTLGSEFHNPINVIPSRVLALNDMRGANVIFIGSHWVNGALARIESLETELSVAKNGRIVVRNPKPGEPAFFTNQVNESTHETLAAFALFSVLPSMDTDRVLVTSGGLSTAGTWAAIDFATSPTGAAQLAAALRTANGGGLPKYYQAVIRAELIKGIPANPSLVMTRIVGSDSAPRQ